MSHRPKVWSILAGLPLLVGCSADISTPQNRVVHPVSGSAAKIVEGAKLQLKSPAQYDAAYFSIPYPGGDIPADRGACTDVVIRALRYAGYDLQKLIHEDMTRHFKAYPRRGDRPDTNIDHRRVPNQRHFFATFGKSLDMDKDWEPGDVVTWKLDSGLDHTGVLSDSVDAKGLPFVIHNLRQTAEEDVLMKWKITGHYRFPK